MGRKTKLNEEAIDSICTSIRGGLWAKQACILAGINQNTYYEWKKEGITHREEGRNTKHVKFLDALEEAEADLEAMLIQRVLEEDKRGPLEILKRRCSARWGDKSTQELSGPGGGPIQATIGATLNLIMEGDDEEDPFETIEEPEEPDE